MKCFLYQSNLSGFSTMQFRRIDLKWCLLGSEIDRPSPKMYVALADWFQRGIILPEWSQYSLRDDVIGTNVSLVVRCVIETVVGLYDDIIPKNRFDSFRHNPTSFACVPVRLLKAIQSHEFLWRPNQPNSVTVERNFPSFSLNDVRWCQNWNSAYMLVSVCLNEKNKERR